jgi:hypothetical protein
MEQKEMLQNETKGKKDKYSPIQQMEYSTTGNSYCCMYHGSSRSGPAIFKGSGSVTISDRNTARFYDQLCLYGKTWGKILYFEEYPKVTEKDLKFSRILDKGRQV